jgi:hypothetical protein
LDAGLLPKEEFQLRLSSPMRVSHTTVLNELLLKDSKTTLSAVYGFLHQPTTRIDAAKVDIRSIGPTARGERTFLANLCNILWAGGPDAKAWVLTQELGSGYRQAFLAVQKRHREQKACIDQVFADLGTPKSWAGQGRQGTVAVISRERLFAMEIMDADEWAADTPALEKRAQGVSDMTRTAPSHVIARGKPTLEAILEYVKLVQQLDGTCRTIRQLHEGVFRDDLQSRRQEASMSANRHLTEANFWWLKTSMEKSQKCKAEIESIRKELREVEGRLPQFESN